MSTDIKKLTKAELIAIINTQSTELVTLRAENSSLKVMLEAKQQTQVQVPEAVAQRYPFVDGIGRRFRVETRGGRTIRCFAPGSSN